MSNDLTIQRTAEAVESPLVINSILESGVRNAPEQEIVYADQRRMSYRDLEERVNRLAGALAECGVKPGDTVAVMDWDTHRYLEAFFAIPMMGAVLHTVNVRLSPEQILYTLNHAEDDVILVNREFLPVLEELKDRIETVKRYVLLDDEGGNLDSQLDIAGEYEALLQQAPAEFDFPELDENTRATTFYTTGTTGLPKGVYFSHRQLVLHTFAGRAALSGSGHGRFNQDDVYMPITPMFHVHAWGVPYVATMLGVKQVYPGRYEPDMLCRLIKEEKVSFSHCVPTILQMVLGAPGAQGHDFGGMKMIIGGSALNRSLYEAAKARGIQLTAAYSMSETCPLISCAYLNEELRAGSEDERTAYRIKAGIPVPLVEAAIMDDEGKLLPSDGEAQGELVLRAPWLTQGYFREPEKGEELWAHGWLHTGDVATIDGMGFIEIRDRIKDVIKTGGEWISSLELEDLISRHAAVREVAVVGVPDPQWGERPFALLVVRDGEALDAKGLKEHLKPFVEQGHINKWAIPSQIALVTEIPKTSVGKLDKKRIRVEIAQWQEAGSAFLSTL